MFGQKKEERKKGKVDAETRNGGINEEQQAGVGSAKSVESLGADSLYEGQTEAVMSSESVNGNADYSGAGLPGDEGAELSEDDRSFTDIVLDMAESVEEFESDLTTAANDSPTAASAAETPAREPSVSAKRAVRNLNEIVGEVFEKGGQKAASYVIDDVLKCDYRAVLMGALRKSRVFKQISEDEELIVDSRRLAELTIAEAVRRECIAEGIEVGNLKTFHFVTLYAVKDSESRLLFAAEANQQKWSVRHLRKIVASHRLEEKPLLDVGRTIISMIGSPLRALEDPDLVTVCSDKDRLLKDLSSTERRKIRTLIKDGKPRLESWNTLLERLDETLTELDGD